MTGIEDSTTCHREAEARGRGDPAVFSRISAGSPRHCAPRDDSLANSLHLRSVLIPSTLGLQLRQQFLEGREFLEGLEVRVLHHPVAVLVAKFDRALEAAQRVGLALFQGEEAGEIVV